MKKFFISMFLPFCLAGCSKSSSDPLAAETWPKHGFLVTTYADVGQTKTDTVYMKAANFAEKRGFYDPSAITDKRSIWTITLNQDGSGQPSYVFIKNEENEYLRIDSIGSPLGREEYIVEIGKPTTPGNGYKFLYHKDGKGFRLESFHRKGWFVTSEGHSQGGNGYEFKNLSASVFWVHAK